MPDGTTRPSPGMSVRATEFPAGTQQTLPGTMPGNGTQVKTDPDGTRTTVTLDRDPRWGMRVPVPRSEVVRTPGGRTTTTEASRSVSLADEADPLSVQSLTTTVTPRVAGRTARSSTSAYQASTRTVEHTSPTGKRTTAQLDAAGRVVELRFRWAVRERARPGAVDVRHRRPADQARPGLAVVVVRLRRA